MSKKRRKKSTKPRAKKIAEEAFGFWAIGKSAQAINAVNHIVDDIERMFGTPPYIDSGMKARWADIIAAAYGHSNGRADRPLNERQHFPKPKSPTAESRAKRSFEEYFLDEIEHFDGPFF